jgi:cytochrome c biogenesis protein CcmG/thiol:disulfide interchange protein DsbE
MKRRLSPAVVVAVVGVAALLGLLAYGLGSSEPDRAIDEALDRGERVEAPELELDRLSGGGKGALADYRGMVVVVNVWASWCDPCRAESPLLERWHKRMATRDGTVLGVDVNDVTSDARAFIEEYGLTYPQLRDPDGASYEAFGVIGLPETFVIDRQGRIAASARGPVDDEFMRTSVAPLLGRS